MPYLRQERLPHIWCPGCGIGTTVNCFTRALTDSGLDLDRVAIVSGIGCTGRVAGYMNLDSFHTTHGRAIPFATGLRLANPELAKVVVYSGDGDLSAIGGNHLIHAARRNMDLMVVCVNNFTYGMTGGQVAPTTPHRRHPDHDAVRQLREPVQPAVPGGRLRRGVRRALDRLPRQAARQGDARRPEEEGVRVHRGDGAVPDAVLAAQPARRRRRPAQVLQGEEQGRRTAPTPRRSGSPSRATSSSASSSTASGRPGSTR